jgi:hypothetical protein
VLWDSDDFAMGEASSLSDFGVILV